MPYKQKAWNKDRFWHQGVVLWAPTGDADGDADSDEHEHEDDGLKQGA